MVEKKDKMHPDDAETTAWILTGLKHEAIRLAKKRRRIQNRELLTLNVALNGQQDSTDTTEVLDTIMDTTDAIAELDEFLLIQHVLSFLTRQQQSVIIATVINNATEQEAAKRLGISQSAVHQIKKRALGRLRRLYETSKAFGLE